MKFDIVIQFKILIYEFIDEFICIFFNIIKNGTIVFIKDIKLM
jgi:hypothetical protein